MALPRHVLTISSQVAAGPVGNSAIAPALLAMGVTPVAVSTIILSNHPGHGTPEGMAMPADKLALMLERVVTLGFLRDDAVVLTGYFANEEQIEAVASFLRARPRSHYLCDPVLGDTHRGLYVAQSVACAIRDRLVPLADSLAPNAFELAWLTGQDVHDGESARAASRTLSGKWVVVTSIPEGEKLTTAVFEHNHATAVTRPKLPDVPHGTGDLFSGLLAARLALGHSLDDSLGFAVAATEHVIAVSAGTASLDLAAGLKNIASVQAFAASHE